MNRRDALKSLALVAGAAGLTVTPVTTQDAQGVELVLLKTREMLDDEQVARLLSSWQACVAGTALETVRTLILDGVDVEVVRVR